MSVSVPETEQTRPILLCLSHLRWDFVFQRPQHLLTRAADTFRVVFVEEPVISDIAEPDLVLRSEQPDVTVATPHLPADLDPADTDAAQRRVLDRLLAQLGGPLDVVWYYTPMAFPFAGHLKPRKVVFDVMDQLSAFDGASPRLALLERQLLRRADIVFAGGRSLAEVKRRVHDNVHLFPSSVDAEHFRKARPGLSVRGEPADQVTIPFPRVGYFGVIDERIDYALLDAVAAMRPAWQFVMVGPTAKIDPASLPRRPNLHWLGMKAYADLPAYLSGWSAGLMPFALNDATRFISPTKTPEFLAAGVPVVSTAVPDVVADWRAGGLVSIASTPAEVVARLGEKLAGKDPAWLSAVDQRLLGMSWDATWGRMEHVIADRPITDVTQPSVPDTAAISLLPRSKQRGPASRPGDTYDWLIVGAGFAGAVMAERLASERGERVLVIDRRDHVGGNAFDHLDAAGVLVHRYGPHIFHTNSEAVFAYLSRFTAWHPYEHRVLGYVDGQLVPVPINLDTVNTLYGLDLTPETLEAWFASRAETVPEIRTSEDVIVSRVGRELYEKFFQGYTRKQWGLDPAQLDASVTARVPVRTNRDDRYFTDKFQAMPRDGYTAMFERLLDHPGIEVRTGTDYADLGNQIAYRRLIWTGPVDEFFGFRFGRLPYRSLRFRHVTHAMERFQQVGTVNYPVSEDYTRVSEYKHMTGQRHPATSVTYEYPTAEGDPYYPIPRPENQALYKRYEALADAVKDTWFVGRLATYRYLNMDQVVGQALATFRRIDAECPRAALAVASESHPPSAARAEPA